MVERFVVITLYKLKRRNFIQQRAWIIKWWIKQRLHRVLSFAGLSMCIVTGILVSSVVYRWSICVTWPSFEIVVGRLSASTFHFESTINLYSWCPGSNSTFTNHSPSLLVFCIGIKDFHSRNEPDKNTWNKHIIAFAMLIWYDKSLYNILIKKLLLNGQNNAPRLFCRFLSLILPPSCDKITFERHQHTSLSSTDFCIGRV